MAIDWSLISVGFLVLMPALVWLRTRLRSQRAIAFGITGYLLTLVAAFVAAVVSGPDTLLWVSLVAAALMYWLSYFEHRPDLSYVAITTVYLGLSQLVTTQMWPEVAYAAILVVSGVTFYVVGYLRSNYDPERSQALRLGGVIGPFLGTLLSLTGGPSQVPVFCLAAAGGLFWVEAYVQQSRSRQELAGGVLLAAYCWLLVYSHITEVQIYSLPWAAYFSYLASRRLDTQPTSRSVLVGAALGALTFPIAIQSLAPDGHAYGLELIFIGLVLMVIGSSQLNRLVLWWGGGAVLIEGLYLLPTYFAPNSEYPVILGLLGLAAFAIVVMYATRRQE